jgi:hypothetical protein
MSSDDKINVDIVSTFASAGVAAAQKGILDLNQSAAQIVAGLRAAAAASGASETEFLAMAGAASTAAMAVGSASQAEQILAIAMEKGAAAAEVNAAAVQSDVAALSLFESASMSAAAAVDTFGKAGTTALTQMLGPLAAIGAGIAVAKSFGDAINFKAQLDEERGAFDGIVGSVQRGNAVLNEGIAVGRQYGFTEKEIVDAFKNLAPAIAASTATTQQETEALARMAVLKPDEPVRALTQAIEGIKKGRFLELAGELNLSKEEAKTLASEVAHGKDAFTALNAALDRHGVTLQVAQQRTEGLMGAERRLQQSQEDLTKAQADFAAGPGLAVIEGQIRTVSGATRVLTLDWQDMAKSAQGAVSSTGQAIKEMIASGGALGALWRLVTGDATANATATQQVGAATQQAATTTEMYAGDLQAGAAATEAMIAASQKNTQALVDETSKKQEAAAKTDELNKLQATLASLGVQVAGGVLTAGNAALQLANMYGIATAEALKLINAQAALAGVKGVSGKTNPRFDDRADVEAMKHAGLQQDAERGRQEAADVAAARRAQVLATGTSQAKIAILKKEYDDAARVQGAGSVAAINAQTKLLQAQEQGSSKRAGAAGAAADKITAIEEKTGDKIEKIVTDTQRKITAITEREAAKQAAALRKLNEDIATATADRRAADESDDLDLVGPHDSKEAAKLNDRERAEADARRRETQAQSEARAQAEAGDAESCSEDNTTSKKSKLMHQQRLDEKVLFRQQRAYRATRRTKRR